MLQNATRSVFGNLTIDPIMGLKGTFVQAELGHDCLVIKHGLQILYMKFFIMGRTRQQIWPDVGNWPEPARCSATSKPSRQHPEAL